VTLGYIVKFGGIMAAFKPSGKGMISVSFVEKDGSDVVGW
jgi:hypothetical protein